MDRVTDLPYIEQVTIRHNNVEGLSAIVINIHHILSDEDRDRIVHAIELLAPSIVRLAATL